MAAALDGERPERGLPGVVPVLLGEAPEGGVGEGEAQGRPP
jgi:hypothetical protein